MAQVPAQLIEIIRQFVAEALKDNIHIERVVLFGSNAKGTNHEYSDIDLAIVSHDFEGISFYDSKKLNRAMLRTSIDIETHTYRPEEFTTDNPFVREILQYGIQIM